MLEGLSNNSNDNNNDDDNYYRGLANKNLIDNELKVLQMFFEYSESDTPYISRSYISDILGIPVNQVSTILNNLVNKDLIIFDPESNKYVLKEPTNSNYKH